MTWIRRKNVDQLAASAALQNTDRVIVAQGGSPEAKYSPLSALGTWLLQFLGTMATQNANNVAITGGSITGTAVHNLPTPSASGDATTKAYVDALALNVASRGAVRVASTANVTIATGLANGQTIDGKTLVTGDLILLKDQSTASQNGVYVAPASGTASRAPQFDTWAELPGCLVVVKEGTANADTLWISTADDGGTLGSTSVPFTRIRIDIAVPVSTGQGGLGLNAGSSTGIPVLVSGVTTITATTGTGAPVRGTAPTIAGGTAAGIGKVTSWKGGYVASRYYTGTWAGGATPSALAANTAYFAPFIVGESHTFDRIAFEITTAGTAANAKLAIYNAANGVPSTLVVDGGTVALSGTGIKSATISQLLAPGAYYLGIVLDGTATVPATGATNLGPAATMGLSSLSAPDTLITGSLTFAAFPATAFSGGMGAITYSSAVVPVLALRA